MVSDIRNMVSSLYKWYIWYSICGIRYLKALVYVICLYNVFM